MSLITETGAGLANADSFAAVLDADLYHSNRGNSAWADLDLAVKEQCLRKATDYLEETYRTRWTGYRFSVAQRLSWPRSWVPLPDAPAGYGAYAAYVPQNIVPPQIVYACAELALKASTGELLPDQSRPKISAGIGPISTTWDRFAPLTVQFLAVKGILRPFLKGNSSTVEMVRS